MYRLAARIALVLGIFALGVACAPTRPAQRLNVFAAASLAAPFSEIASRFSQQDRGVIINPQFAGSQILLAQLDQGARADVLATASLRDMEKARQLGLVAGEPAVFARNRLAIITPTRGSALITRWTELGRSGIRLAIAAQAVPAGDYARQVIGKLAALPEAGPGFTRRVLANVVSEDEDVARVVAKVALGEVDAGFVYATDALGKDVLTVDIPADRNVEASYPVAVVTAGGNRSLAERFVAEVLGAGGQTVLRRFGFVTVR